jgi:protein SCO1/2
MKAYKGKVYVLEFFFTTCPSICPKMNQSMLLIEKKFLQSKLGIVSIVLIPKHDTPKVLKEHADF